jgi:hypothetical protein
MKTLSNKFGTGMAFAASQFWSWLGEDSNNKHDINPADTEYH